MSMQALLRGVESYLAQYVPLTPGEVGVRLRGRPPASGGQVYYGIYPTRYGRGPSPDQILGIDSLYGFGVAITLRTGYIPDDRIPEVALLNDDTGIYARVSQLIYLLHVYRHSLLCEINKFIVPSGADPFVEPFEWEYADPEPRWEGPDWFSADPTQPDLDKYYGLVTEVRFTGGRRLQKF